jgi:DNA-binding LytR/AlgR family response regulator
VFNQKLDQLKIPAIAKTAGPDKLKTLSELLIPNKDSFERIQMDRISHINVEDHYCRIFVKHSESIKEFFIQISLKEILDQLPPESFLQIHRSHVVNLAFVSSLLKDSRSYQLALNQGAHTLPISRHRLPQVLSILNKFIN